MTISPGTRLGSYEITNAIGAGGMGEVFRARDTRLNRDVAIKVLPAAAADESEGVANDKVVFFFDFGEYLKKIAPTARAR